MKKVETSLGSLSLTDEGVIVFDETSVETLFRLATTLVNTRATEELSDNGSGITEKQKILNYLFVILFEQNEKLESAKPMVAYIAVTQRGRIRTDAQRESAVARIRHLGSNQGFSVRLSLLSPLAQQCFLDDASHSRSRRTPLQQLREGLNADTRRLLAALAQSSSTAPTWAALNPTECFPETFGGCKHVE